MVTGTVIKSTGSWYAVKDENGNRFQARIKGKLRLNEIKNTNPVAVGDHVHLEPQPDNTFAITKILNRKNYIIRRSVNLSKQSHIIAANIDQALLIVTIDEPFTPLGFIDRFLVTAEAYHIPVTFVFNKWDLYKNKTLDKAEKWFTIYSQIGYNCIKFSAIENKKKDLVNIIENKISLICGNSGVGKSTLINLIQPQLNLKTASVSDYHRLGMHTTTFYEMFDLDFGGSVIDCPGIKGFGVIDINKNELSHYFPEMRQILSNCKFNNCLHMEEPGCAVKYELENGRIAEHRYKNYINMYFDRVSDDEKDFN